MLSYPSNLYSNSLSLTLEPEYYEETIPVVNGMGQTTRLPIEDSGHTTGIARFFTPISKYISNTIDSIKNIDLENLIFDHSKDETVTFNRRSFTLSDTSFSGDIRITYLCNKYLLLVPFSVYVSGITQVIRLISDIIIKQSSAADAHLMKGATVDVRIISSMNAENIYCTKYAYPEIGISFVMGSAGYCIKHTTSAIDINFSTEASPMLNKGASSDVIYVNSCGASPKVGRYATINDYASYTLNDMKDRTINDLLFVYL